MNASELVIKLHDLARETKDSRIRTIADNLAEVARDHSDKGYRESTLEKCQEFARKREGFYDVGNMSYDDIKRAGRE